MLFLDVGLSREGEISFRNMATYIKRSGITSRHFYLEITFTDLRIRFYQLI